MSNPARPSQNFTLYKDNTGAFSFTLVSGDNPIDIVNEYLTLRVVFYTRTGGIEVGEFLFDYDLDDLTLTNTNTVSAVITKERVNELFGRGLCFVELVITTATKTESLYVNQVQVFANTQGAEQSNASTLNVDGDFNVTLDVANLTPVNTSRGVESIADLRLTRSTTVKEYVNVLGYYESGDGGGGEFYWDADSVEDDNDGTIIKVTAVTTGRWKRVDLGFVNVKWFGAKGDGITNDRDSLLSSITISNNVYFPSGTYICESDFGNGIFITNDTIWRGDDAIIKANPSSQISSLCYVNLNGASISIEGITFDANFKCNRALYINNNALNMNEENLSKVFLRNITAKQAYRLNTLLEGGDGIFIRGAFSLVEIKDSFVTDCKMAEGAGIATVIGITGITITHYGLDAYANRVIFDNVTIDSVYSEDDTFEFDQDGCRVFAPHTSSEGAFIKSFFTVTNSSFKNCYGRSIKSQMFFNKVSNCDFYRDKGFLSGVGNPEIDYQVSGGQVSNCDFYYKNQQVPSTLVLCSASESSDTPYRKTSFSITDLQVYLDPLTTMNSVVSTFPRGGELGTINIERVNVLGSCVRFLNYAVNGNFIFNRASVKDCLVEDILEDDDLNRVFVKVTASGGTSPYRCNVILENNIHSGDNEVYLLQDGVSGFSADANTSSYGNLGFIENQVTSIDSSLRENQVFRPSAIGLKDGGIGDSFTQFYNFVGGILNANTITEIDVRNTQGLYVILKIEQNRNAYSVFNCDSGGTIGISTGTLVTLGNTTQVGTTDFRVWVGTNKIFINNATANNRIYSLWVLGS